MNRGAFVKSWVPITGIEDAKKMIVFNFISSCYLNQNILVYGVGIINLLGPGQHSKIFTENGYNYN